MPMLGDIFLNTIYSEDVNGSARTTDHPIEDGAETSDHVEVNSREISFSGVVVGKDQLDRKNKLERYRNTRKLLEFAYVGRKKNVVITRLNTTNDTDTANGFKFSITLKEIRISKATAIKKIKPKTKSKVGAKGNKGLQQTKGSTASKVYVVKSGDSLSKIASKYNVNINKLYEKNRGVIGGDKNKIYPGQKLIIPA